MFCLMGLQVDLSQPLHPSHLASVDHANESRYALVAYWLQKYVPYRLQQPQLLAQGIGRCTPISGL